MHFLQIAFGIIFGDLHVIDSLAIRFDDCTKFFSSWALASVKVIQ